MFSGGLEVEHRLKCVNNNLLALFTKPEMPNIFDNKSLLQW